MKRLTSWCTFLVLWMVLAASAAAQTRSNDNQPAIDSGAVVTGVTFVKAGEWTQLRNIVGNPTANDVNVIVVNTLGSASNVQFGTTLWLPPHSMRVIDLPARVSDDEHVKPRSGLEIQTMLLSQTDTGREKSWLSRQTGQGIVEGNTLNISILGQSDDHVFDLASEIRLTAENEKGVRAIPFLTAPFTVLAWQPLSAVIIPQTPKLDARQMDAMRSWLLAGGKIWLMLDQVDPAFASELLGDLWDVAVLDDVRLSRVTFGRTKQAGDEYDQPVKMVRTLPGSAKILSNVGPWPASMSISAGKGEVIVTTLEARAWKTKHAKATMQQIGSHLLVRGVRQGPLAQAANDLAATSIGRPIVGRNVVLSILLVMIILMIAAGIVFYRMGRLEYMGAVAPAIAVLVALILLGIGKSRQGEVPLTISTVSIMHVTPELGQAVVMGSTAVYSPAMQQGPLQATTGGMVWPDLSGLQGRVVRLLVNDLNTWKWQGVEFSSGVIRTGWFEQTIRLDQPITLKGKFGAKGLQLQANLGPLADMRDMLLATPGGIMSLATENPTASDVMTMQNYSAGPDNVLEARQYVAAGGAMLSEEQQQRQAFYAQLYNTPSGLPDQPNLMGWVKNLSPGLKLDDAFDERSASLVMIPLEMEAPAAGDEVLVPSTFMAFDVVRVPGERTSATVYNRNTGEWIPITNPTRMALAFTLPPSVLPLEIERATFTLAIRAPGRTVELFTREGVKGEPVYSQDSPTGSLVFEFGPEHKLKADAHGTVLVIVGVGDEENSQLWEVRGVKLQVQGRKPASISAAKKAAPGK